MSRMTAVMAVMLFAILIAGADYAKAQSCSAVTDAQLVSTIYTKIKADRVLSSQISHINVVAVNAAVKLQGWANSKSDFDRLRDLVSTTSCVRVVNVNAFEESPPDVNSPYRTTKGCASGTKPCGDVCIPEGDACNITAESGQ